MDEDKVIKNFFIKSGYILNKKIETNTGKNIYWTKKRLAYIDIYSQYHVYKFCRRLIKRIKIKSVLDIGCGNASKLMKLIYPVCNDVYGIDEKRVIDFIRKKYNLTTFLNDNIEKSTLNLKKKFDLIICADVIEHLQNPDNLINYIKKYSHQNTYIVISTPERDIMRGKNCFNSPNKEHVREWNRSEFNKYIEKSGLKMINNDLFLDFMLGLDFNSNPSEIKNIILGRIRALRRKNSLNKLKYNQVVICKIGIIDNYSKYIVNKILERKINKIDDLVNYFRIKIYNIFYFLYRFLFKLSGIKNLIDITINLLSKGR